ncbi:GntR family transcriptional regulator [Janibacter sp. GS2]|uniref:GntR family transcriptional regulator n=1 Tax=Janibacter sp. GS2 TaxID=3442646 RepID=UPI003EC0A4A4
MATARSTGAGLGAPLADLTVLVPEGTPVGSRSAIAYYLIRDLIVTLELPPGGVVVERELMERLGLGRTPVREALRRLGDEGLVLIYARRGMVVAPVHASDLEEVSEVRVDLEGLAARQAARRADAHDRRSAADLVAQVHGRDHGQDPRDLIRLDQRVHHCVHRAAHNGYLQSTADEYLTLSLRLWFLGLDRVPRLDAAVAEHSALLRAVADGDAVGAEAAARAHVVGFWQAIRAVLATPVAPGRVDVPACRRAAP